MERIEAGALPEGSDDPVVLLVRNASGDEEVGAAGANLKGVILCHSLPHLSHLGEPHTILICLRAVPEAAEIPHLLVRFR